MAAPGTLDQPGGCRDLSEEEYDIDGDSDWGDFHHFGEQGDTSLNKFEKPVEMLLSLFLLNLQCEARTKNALNKKFRWNKN